MTGTGEPAAEPGVGVILWGYGVPTILALGVLLLQAGRPEQPPRRAKGGRLDAAILQEKLAYRALQVDNLP